MSDWRTYLQDQPSKALQEIGERDPALFAQVTNALTRLDGSSGEPVDEWGDLRNVVLAPGVTGELFVHPDADPPSVDVLRIVWLSLS
ncbi:hypothetical protein BX285_6894 [Streptomyces sp. 1114.5]|uniref:hypothetical protein n=1 Tax=unclassified Streptomyces TaxID=2593676 RepID=UPI000BCE70D7|nr:MULTISPECIES: hypothetical protein [unclassified Streptomyces]RKT09789.1 hypothetical protein BX285_6894 [Streptomyces sp. 1114.5]SOB88861.1 hypothetical protein SAMN06272789_7182 [Streptomyces sp. 1331.2]